MILPKTEEVIKSIDEIYQNEIVCEEHEIKAPVCIICDSICPKHKQRIISIKDIISNKEILKPQRDIPNDLRKYYTYKGNGSIPSVFKDMLLSPKGSYNDEKEGFIICTTCNYATKKQMIPTKAISNFREIGTPPDILLQLSEIEIALISIIRVHGHIFTFFVGSK